MWHALINSELQSLNILILRVVFNASVSLM